MVVTIDKDKQNLMHVWCSDAVRDELCQTNEAGDIVSGPPVALATNFWKDTERVRNARVEHITTVAVDALKRAAVLEEDRERREASERQDQLNKTRNRLLTRVQEKKVSQVARRRRRHD